MGHSVAVVGATGAVGEEILAILEQRNAPVDELRLFASPRSGGRRIAFRGEQIVLRELSGQGFVGIDTALFSAGSATSKEWAPVAAEAGAVVIDNSSAFRMDDGVPLVVPEVNPAALSSHRGIIANPNCTTIILLVALAPIHRRYGIRRASIATYQAASGAGARAMQELETQTRQHLEGKTPTPEIFPAVIAFNLIPHCDVFLEDGFTREEQKVLWESRKILSDPNLNLAVTAVRVPVLRAHAEALHLELAAPYELAEVRAMLDAAPGLRLIDGRSAGAYPMPSLASGGDDVLAGRLRRDPTSEHGLALFICGDQLRKGAALNAVQIAELLWKEGA